MAKTNDFVSEKETGVDDNVRVSRVQRRRRTLRMILAVIFCIAGVADSTSIGEQSSGTSASTISLKIVNNGLENLLQHCTLSAHKPHGSGRMVVLGVAAAAISIINTSCPQVDEKYKGIVNIGRPCCARAWNEHDSSNGLQGRMLAGVDE
jgi:hypothetical protein